MNGPWERESDDEGPESRGRLRTGADPDADGLRLARTGPGGHGDFAARRYVHIEVGAVAQNVHLQAEALELGTVPIGALRDERVRNSLGLPARHAPLALMPVGLARR